MGYNGDHPQSDSMKQDDVQQGSEIDTRKQDDVCNKLLLEPKLTRLQGHERIVWSSVRRSWCDVAGYAFATAAVIAPFSGFNIVTGCFVTAKREK